MPVAGPGRTDDDRTPMMPDTQPIPPSSLPGHPGLQHDDTIRASHRQPLMSPFRTHYDPNTMMPYPDQFHPQYIDPSTAFYHPVPPQQLSQYMYHNGSPQDVVYAQGHPMPVPMPMYPPGQPYYAPQPGYGFTGPSRSHNGSPSSSTNSSGNSLNRSESISSELKPARPKVKLTAEDKRKIVEIAEGDTSLRQEDIARIYG